MRSLRRTAISACQAGLRGERKVFLRDLASRTLAQLHFLLVFRRQFADRHALVNDLPERLHHLWRGCHAEINISFGQRESRHLPEDGRNLPANGELEIEAGNIKRVRIPTLIPLPDRSVECNWWQRILVWPDRDQERNSRRHGRSGQQEEPDRFFIFVEPKPIHPGLALI